MVPMRARAPGSNASASVVVTRNRESQKVGIVPLISSVVRGPFHTQLNRPPQSVLPESCPSRAERSPQYTLAAPSFGPDARPASVPLVAPNPNGYNAVARAG
jgi:hypothetical protein